MTNKSPAHATDSDGDINVDDYELDFDATDIGARDRDSTNNVIHHVTRFADSDIWVAYSTSQTDPSESSWNVKGIGHFSIEACELDRKTMIETYRDGLADVVEALDFHNINKPEHVDTVVDALIEEWQSGVEDFLDTLLLNGNVVVLDKVIMAEDHVEGVYAVVNHALDEVFLRNEPSEEEQQVAFDALSAAIDKHRTQWNHPHAEFFAHVRFECEPWELRALELRHNGVFANKPELAKVAALTEKGCRQNEIMEILEKSQPTVSRQVSQVEGWTDRAEWTVSNY